MGKFEPDKAPIHGHDHDKQLFAWEFAQSLFEGIEDGSYTRHQIKTKIEERLAQLNADPLSLKAIGLPKEHRPPGKGKGW
jgi:hypothetical protein